MNDNTNSTMEKMTERAEKFINAIGSAFMTAGETAADQIQLSAQVVAIRQRMQAHQFVLEAVAAQKAQVLERMAQAKGALRLAYARQIEVLEAQELGILKSLGIEEDTAKEAIDSVEDDKLYRRNGRRFEAIGNGN